MLSICGGIYHNANIVPFVRSVLENADEPGEIEFSVAEDESGTDLMARAFEKVRTMTKNLNVIQVPKEERITYFERCIAFYEREKIFPRDTTLRFRHRLSMYASGNSKLWWHPAWLHNKVVAASSGEVILLTPLDLLATFDLTKTYRQFKEARALRKHLCVLFGLREGNKVRQHGIKMFNRGLFDTLKKSDPKYGPGKFTFDERWFSPAYGEDDWNERARLAGGESLGWEELFGEPRMFLMPDSPWFPEYICDDMARDHGAFLTCMQGYLKGEEAQSPLEKGPF